MGRRKIKINEEEVEKLASYGLSPAKIADFFGVHEHTISTRFKHILKARRAKLEATILQAQLRVALQGSVPMLIHLGKVVCGQREQTENVAQAGNRQLIVMLERPSNATQKKVVQSHSSNPRELAPGGTSGSGGPVLREPGATDIIGGACPDGKDDSGDSEDSNIVGTVSGIAPPLGAENPALHDSIYPPSVGGVREAEGLD